MRNFAYLPKYNYEDYLNWEGRWELIDGIPIAMNPLPSLRHQNISGNIHALLKQLLKNCKKCTPLLPVDWKVSEDTILQPDNSVICYPAGDVNYITKAPSLIFEILSPSTSTKDKTVKYEIYQEQSVKYYIIIDPKANSAEVFELVDGNYRKKITATNEKVSFNLVECDFEFDFSQIWQ
jgi:Uma2 family endonuclease